MLKVVPSEKNQVLKRAHCKCVEDVNTLSSHNLLVHSRDYTLARGHRMVYNNHVLCTLKLMSINPKGYTVKSTILKPEDQVF